jgi:hypothetical protein
MKGRIINWSAKSNINWGRRVVLFAFFMGWCPAQSADRQEKAPLPGLAEVHQMIHECERVVFAGSLGEWTVVQEGKFKHIEFESGANEFRVELKKWLDPERWKKIEKDELVTFAAGTVLAIDLHFKGDHVRRRVIFISGQLSVGHEAWIEKEDPGPGLSSAGMELAKLLARPEYVNQVVDMTIEEAKACIKKKQHPWEDPRFKGVDNDPKWRPRK